MEKKWEHKSFDVGSIVAIYLCLMYVALRCIWEFAPW